MDENPFPEIDPFASKPKMRATFGERLPDGSVLELVVVDGRLLLCHSNGKQHLVLPSLEFDNIMYTPPQLEPSLYRALRFPGPPSTESGSMTQLFEDATAIFQQRGFSTEISGWAGLFSLVSWLPELFQHPPTLVLYGFDMLHAALLFTLMQCTCRRAFFTPQLCRALPFFICPTLLILAADASAKQYAFWRAANARSVFVPCRGGGVQSLACARALFMRGDDALEAIGDEAWRVPLPPNANLSRVTDDELAQISRDLLPRMLAFRLRRLAQVPSDPGSQERQFASTGIRQLLMLSEGEDLAKHIARLVADQEAELSEWRKRDPHRAIVEALWGPCHTDKRMSLEELTTRVNALLFASGELITFQEREIGWRCRQLGIGRQRSNEGMYIRFSADIRRTLHHLARNFGLELPQDERCAYCS